MPTGAKPMPHRMGEFCFLVTFLFHSSEKVCTFLGYSSEKV